jgi:hypothetical protein
MLPEGLGQFVTCGAVILQKIDWKCNVGSSARQGTCGVVGSSWGSALQDEVHFYQA